MIISLPSFPSSNPIANELSCDVLIIGAGLAGLIAALSASEAGLKVILAFKPKDATDSNSAYAQGGIAAYVEWNTPDSLEQHVQDTLEAGAGYNNETVVRQILAEGNQAIKTLMRYGVAFDLDPEGVPALTQEGAHSQRRILHVNGDQTGLGIVTPLIERVKNASNIQTLPYHALNALHQGSSPEIIGASLYDSKHSQYRKVHTSNVVLATGGYAGLYRHATNTAVDGIQALFLAHQAGAGLKDLHLVQFHPTAFVTEGKVRFLASESLRGEGGRLINVNGERFMAKVHPLAELAPRDVVARAIAAEMVKTKHPCVYLDMRHENRRFLEQRFPNIYHMALDYHIDMTTDLLPVAPAAHYCMGGIEASFQGETSVKGLFAIGEASCTGLHGANRLASNSLLECVVMGSNVVNALFKTSPKDFSDSPTLNTPSDNVVLLGILKALMWRHLGLQRSPVGYEALHLEIERLKGLYPHEEGFYFLVKTALSQAKAMSTSCGSHHILDLTLAVK